jgi:methanethiol S-methyltransferase
MPVMTMRGGLMLLYHMGTSDAMTKVARMFVWAGGGMFVASLAVCAYHYLVVWGRPVAPRGPESRAAELAVDFVLMTLFAVHHSVFARARVKIWLASLVAQPLLRSVYVWIASALLILVCVLWRPVGGNLYQVAGAGAAAHAGLQLAGVGLIACAVAGLDPLELAGIHPSPGLEALTITGVYHWVRHPLYLGWMLAVFGTAHMTGDRLAFAVLTSIYLVVAVPWEERSLVRTFGESYVRYQRAVRWRIIPFIY